MQDTSKIIGQLYNAINDRKNIYINEPMSRHTSFRIGGPADYFIKVTSLQELKDILKIANRFDIPYFIIGNGTNLLVSDEGIRGFVIKICLNEFTIKKNSEEYVIKGGIHSYFGSYGLQDGDGTPTITNEQQLVEAADVISTFCSE